jgi:hypothetical protein
MNSKNNSNKPALITFAVIAAFGLLLAVVAVLPIVPQSHAAVAQRVHMCKDGTSKPCNQQKARREKP